MAHSVLDTKLNIETLQTGIDDLRKPASMLCACVSDSYLLMVKTQGYHWNVAGPLFYSLHKLTEEHYTDLFSAIDDLAERIRALGYPAPTSITEMIPKSIVEEDIDHPTAEQMIENLTQDHEAIANRFREFVGRAEDSNDTVTADMLTARIRFHEQAVWMLRALLTS